MMSANGLPENMVFGLDIGTRSIVGTVGYKNNETNFTVVAQYTKFHDTRAIIDGQVHDIEKVAETILAVKKELEKQTGKKLCDVCIAAAGRVLKTIEVHTEYLLEEEAAITQEHIRTLIAGGIEKAYGVIGDEIRDPNVVFSCVGHTVIRYYLNGYLMTNIESHKGKAIAADIIATFLPQEVVDGLYASVEKAGLQVADMTLEPIAAINVAIPENFRLLNIALVDVGAGTSDISITKDGSIIAYGMIPCAGDAITECIMKDHLVDFKTAEEIKLASGRKKEVSFKDILKMKHKLPSEEIREEVQPVIKNMTGKIAERIIELNGGKPVSAVFVVGGGGKFKTFIPELAKQLQIPSDRVALRGEEVLGQVEFLQEKIKKDSTLVTPIGICLNYYEQKNNIIFITVNDERIKLYDNSKLAVMDAALKYGFPNEKMFPRRGEALEYSLNGDRRMVRGQLGEAAVILLNGKQASINTPIIQHDQIQIQESTIGKPAEIKLSELPEFKKNKIHFIVNGKKITCPRIISVNGQEVTEDYIIQNGDEIQYLDYYTAEQLYRYMDIDTVGELYINRAPALREEKIYDNFTVEVRLNSVVLETEDQDEPAEQAEENEKGRLVSDYNESNLTVRVNDQEVLLKGKEQYRLVDVLDFYPFDLSVMKGSAVALTINGEKAEFVQLIKENDEIRIYWEN